jgi:transcriptional regulator with XRE-family HTH domain
MAILLHELLFEKYMEYQKISKKRKTLKEFSEYIGIGQVHLNRLMNGRRKAGEKTIARLADFFNDPGFYDAVGMDRPEPLLTYTKRNWGSVPEEVKKKIAEEVSQYTTDPLPENANENGYTK